ncbi:MAG: xanthine dehydrogenase family protein subunit M [Saccharolobus sp.]|uniref:FAD binding domain-containing protein n=1 Tax=Saccharolobus sp. TaxID=2100761 RepID=UPI00317623FF
MRERLPDFEYLVPTSLTEVAYYLNAYDNAYILAGGTDLLVAIKLKGLRPKTIISMKKIKELLRYIIEENNYLRIGALVTLNELKESPIISTKFKVLHEAVAQMATYPIRNMATIGGNLCNASPAADTAPPLMVLNAKLIAMSLSGEREIAIENFFIGPGKTALQKGEFLKEIKIPLLPANSGAAFIKMKRRKSADISIASSAVYLQLEGDLIIDARIALGSVAPTPIRAYSAEESLKEKKVSEELLSKAAQKASIDCSPIDDVRSSAEYRKEIVKVLTERALQIAIKRARGVVFEYED